MKGRLRTTVLAMATAAGVGIALVPGTAYAGHGKLPSIELGFCYFNSFNDNAVAHVRLQGRNQNGAQVSYGPIDVPANGCRDLYNWWWNHADIQYTSNGFSGVRTRSADASRDNDGDFVGIYLT